MKKLIISVVISALIFSLGHHSASAKPKGEDPTGCAPWCGCCPTDKK